MTSLYKVVIHVALIGMALTSVLFGVLNFQMWTSQSMSYSLRVKETFFGVYKSSVSSRLVHVGVATTMAADETDTGNKPNQALHTLYQKLHVRAPRRVGPTVSKPTNCYREHCTEYLNKNELLAMNRCLQETSKRITKESKSPVRENDCNFIDGSHRRPVALASTEGSGNTWIRGLLEKATGICTGFLYCDCEMRHAGFIGEGVKSGSVLVVKTHTGLTQWHGEKYAKPKRDEPYYGSAIFILRNPYDSLISEWNRRVTNAVMKKRRMPHDGSHRNVVPEEYWRGSQWDEFLHTYMDKWKMRTKNWVIDSINDHPVHVVRYESLKRNTTYEVAKMLTFLDVPYSRKNLSTRLRDDFTAFKRNHTSDSFEHYSMSQKEHIRNVLLETIHLAQSANLTSLLQLDEYLQW